MGRVRVVMGAAVVAAMVSVAGAGAAHADVPGDTPETAIPIALNTPVTVPNVDATAGPGDEGGHSVWFKYANPGADAILAADLDGSDFDTVLGFGTSRTPGPVTGYGAYDEAHPAAHESLPVMVYGSGAETYWRIDGATPDDVGTIRFELRDRPAAADRWSTPATLDLSPGAPAVASASQALASPGLEAGEPGAASDGASVWWRFVAPATGPLVLDTCLSQPAFRVVGQAVLRVVTDDPLGAEQVLASDGTADTCQTVTIAATAGTAYRVQSSVTALIPNAPDGRTVVLRALMAGTPPAVTLGMPRSCDAGSALCVPVQAIAAPGSSLQGVECQVAGGAWASCAVDAGGPYAQVPLAVASGFGGGARVAARATDDAARSALAKARVVVGIPTGGDFGGGRPPVAKGPGPRPSAAPKLRRLQAPRARFVVGRHGTRVRWLRAPAMPKGATVRVRCAGRHKGCPLTSRTVRAKRAGTLGLTALLRHRTLRAGAVLTVRVAAKGRATRVVSWRVRAHRAPSRTLG